MTVSDEQFFRKESHMKAFMDKDFLLETETARKLFHDYAEGTPILDYHCHVSPREIAEDRRFENITQVWLGGDHYKWRLMRSFGVEEKYITGDASDYEKFCKWAECLGRAIGNPLFHWSHLELQRYFGYHGVLNRKSADEVWNLCNEKLAQPSMSVRNLIKQSNVTLICTTDDPVDTLEWHKKIAEDKSFDVKVLPAWRPDRAMDIEKSDYLSYLDELAAAAGMGEINSFAALKEALLRRMDFFASMGCRVSDHGLEYVMYAPAGDDEIEAIFLKRLNRMKPTHEEGMKFRTAFMLFAGREYHKRDWAMQLHFGCRRDNNKPMYKKIGPDTGFDCINNDAPSWQLAEFLNALVTTDQLPRTVLYSLNPNDNHVIGSILGCFQDATAIAKIQQGSAWWFNDHKTGIQDQMTSLANMGILSGFVGMLTDSRSFLSYTRHEYFRRILCSLLGGWVENGEFPGDMDTLSEIVKDISYYNAVKYFKFDL
jgi:glucuronate isomerase